MVVKKEAIAAQLRQLDTVVQELAKYRGTSPAQLSASLSLRWTVERGLIAAATLAFDIANEILGGHFGIYPETYEDSLRLLMEQKVIGAALYARAKGLGGFRNILVHEYVAVDLKQLARGLERAFELFPEFSAAVTRWLKRLS